MSHTNSRGGLGTMRWIGTTLVLVSGAAALVAACTSGSSGDGSQESAPVAANRTPGEAFASPEAAVLALAAIAGQGDIARVTEILGAEGVELLQSGDPVADRADGLRAKELIEQKLAFRDGPDGMKVALIGPDEWPFAIPLAKTADGWKFDVVTGAEELGNRRVGRNELSTIATLRELVAAQREYFAVPRDGRPRAFAQKFASTPGRKDGLFWHAVDGEEESPLGPLAAEAAAEGYRRSETGEPIAYHGYHYRMLLAQGPHAPGGAKSYVDENGHMTGGFAAIAWPAKYDHSGTVTFLVNHRGIVFQQDLGEETEAVVATITTYDPDEDWAPVAAD